MIQVNIIMQNPKFISRGIVLVGMLLVTLVFGQGVGQMSIRQLESPLSQLVVKDYGRF